MRRRPRIAWKTAPAAVRVPAAQGQRAVAPLPAGEPWSLEPVPLTPADLTEIRRLAAIDTAAAAGGHDAHRGWAHARAVRDALRFLQHPHVSLRSAAALVRRFPQALIAAPALSELLLARALDALGTLADETDGPPARALAVDERFRRNELRSGAGELLRVLVDAPAINPAAWGVAVRRYLTVDLGRALALLADNARLEGTGLTSADVVDALTHESDEVRLLALRALGQLPPPEVAADREPAEVQECTDDDAANEALSAAGHL